MKNRKKSEKLRQMTARTCSGISLLASVITLLVAGPQLLWWHIALSSELLKKLLIAGIVTIATLPMGVAVWFLLIETVKWFFTGTLGTSATNGDEHRLANETSEEKKPTCQGEAAEDASKEAARSHSSNQRSVLGDWSPTAAVGLSNEETE